uniref:Kazal-like serine protease inhibitor EPI3 n=1 Tax=Phytophthora infestans TaxID=4787 RepID=Q6PQH0_PHYIN|nr:Kazal-like serine protease inhibitor EPI3 [Phytophthora infestans]
MKITFFFALLAVTISSSAGDSVSARKLALSPGFEGSPCADMLCPEVHDPVCGTDKVTYPNECDLGLAQCAHPERNITVFARSTCAAT